MPAICRLLVAEIERLLHCSHGCAAVRKAFSLLAGRSLYEICDAEQKDFKPVLNGHNYCDPPITMSIERFHDHGKISASGIKSPCLAYPPLELLIGMDERACHSLSV